MLNKYYDQELKRIREIAAEFAKDNQTLAPLLKEPSSDPGIERLLQGVAFIGAGIRDKLDDEVPEIIHEVLRKTWPQYLRPIPAFTLMSVLPGEKLNETTTLPSGTYVDSIPVNETPCTFKTCHDVDVHPLAIQGVEYQEPPGQNPYIRLTFSLINQTAAEFRPKRLCLHLSGNYSEATDLYLRFRTGLEEIRIQAQKEERILRLEPSCLNPLGFSYEEALIPWPPDMYDGYRLIQEYFLMPEKFLFIELTGWDEWGSLSSSNVFYVDFVLTGRWTETAKPGIDSFSLSIVPAINLFPHSAAPVTVDHTRTYYPVNVDSEVRDNYQVYSIEKVYVSSEGGTKDLEFEPFHSFATYNADYAYHERVKNNPVKDAVDFSVSLSFKMASEPELESLSFDILCTNGYLTENLSEGDIRFPKIGAHESISFSNIRKPTISYLPPIGSEILWEIDSLMSLRHMTLDRPEYLQRRLRIQLLEGYRDKLTTRINERRIQGIKELKAYPVSRLFRKEMCRGLEILITVSKSHFESEGDAYLFGSVLDRYLPMYVSLFSFTRLIMKEADSGTTYTWPERMGSMPLI